MVGPGNQCEKYPVKIKFRLGLTVLPVYFAEQKDKRCFAPLHCASLTGNADCISTLLDGGSEVNSRGFAGATALHITVRNTTAS